MKTALITGATSFLGVSLIDTLVNNKVEVYAVVRPNSDNLNRLKSYNVNLIELDIANFSELKKLDLPAIDAFYHLAWHGTRGDMRDDKKIQSINFQASIHALQTAISCKCKVFIGAGSQAEYGQISGEIPETDQLELPNTQYGKAKLQVYKEAKTILKNNNIRFVWPRIFSLYGPNDYQNTLVMSSLKK